MTIFLAIILLLILFSSGIGGYYGYRRGGPYMGGGIGLIGLLLIILLIYCIRSWS